MYLSYMPTESRLSAIGSLIDRRSINNQMAPIRPTHEFNSSGRQQENPFINQISNIYTISH